MDYDVPDIDPPILNSAGPWATTEADLKALHDSPYVGAVTTRTVCLEPFPHDDNVHQYSFFDKGVQPIDYSDGISLPHLDFGVSSINSLGYSPVSFNDMIELITKWKNRRKLLVVSIAGSPDEVLKMRDRLRELAQDSHMSRILVEINLSCPNIPGKPPPGYDLEQLDQYLSSISSSKGPSVGLKLPPYTYENQFDGLISFLISHPDAGISFLTSTNTLGSSLYFDKDEIPLIKSTTGTGIGGVAGQALHPLALGNVATLRRKLDSFPELRKIKIIGVGGVFDLEGFARMKKAGADFVAAGTAVALYGPKIFQNFQIKGKKSEPASNGTKS